MGINFGTSKGEGSFVSVMQAEVCSRYGAQPDEAIVVLSASASEPRSVSGPSQGVEFEDIPVGRMRQTKSSVALDVMDRGLVTESASRASPSFLPGGTDVLRQPTADQRPQVHPFLSSHPRQSHSSVLSQLDLEPSQCLPFASFTHSPFSSFPPLPTLRSMSQPHYQSVDTPVAYISAPSISEIAMTAPIGTFVPASEQGLRTGKTHNTSSLQVPIPDGGTQFDARAVTHEPLPHDDATESSTICASEDQSELPVAKSLGDMDLNSRSTATTWSSSPIAKDVRNGQMGPLDFATAYEPDDNARGAIAASVRRPSSSHKHLSLDSSSVASSSSPNPTSTTFPSNFSVLHKKNDSEYVQARGTRGKEGDREQSERRSMARGSSLKVWRSGGARNCSTLQFGMATKALGVSEVCTSPLLVREASIDVMFW